MIQDSFTYNNVIYNLNDEVLLKYKSRIVKYTIKKIILKINESYCVSFLNTIYNITKNIEFKLGTTHKFIKKYFSYNEPPTIICKNVNKSLVVYGFKCDFCNILHKHNNLGHNDCRCCSIYSPYYSSGYNLIIDDTFSNFNDYILYNFELFLKKNKYKGWASYKLSVKKFYNGTICDDYGKKKFPYISKGMIEYIRIKYEKDNKSCSNGCLVAGLHYLIKMILNKCILYVDYKYKKDLNNLYKFHKNVNDAKIIKIINLLKCKSHNILNKKITTNNNTTNNNTTNNNTTNNNTTNNNTTNNNTTNNNTTNNNTTNELNKSKKSKESKDSKESKESKKSKESNESKESNNLNKLNSIDNSKQIVLDVMCGVELIENLSIYHKNKIIEMIKKDYKDKYFYTSEDLHVYSEYFDFYDPLYLCIMFLEEANNIITYCIDEADCYDPDFINYKLNKNKEMEL